MKQRVPYGLVILGILVPLVVLEGALRVYVSIRGGGHPTGATPAILAKEDPIVPDTRLGFRNDPAYPGLDKRGWRNRAALEHADIVALGDSFAYGVTVPLEEAWPQRLSAISHRSVYQMAVPGYGPGQFLLLFDEAAALRPKAIIAQLYFGNDFMDAYWLAYRAGDAKQARPDAAIESLKSTNPRIRRAIHNAEGIDPDLLRSDYVDCQRPRPVPDARLQTVHNILAAPPLAPLAGHRGASPQPSGRRLSLDDALRRLSVLYRVVSRRVGAVWHRLQPFAGVRDYGSPICVHYRDGRLVTIFTPAYRLLAVDRTDPRVVEGERLSWLMLQALAQRCRRADIRFYVALLPTKEAVFRAHALAHYRTEPYLRDQWNAEESARQQSLAFFERHGIAAIDTLGPQQALVASGVNPYEEDANGHPAKPGYEAIARAIAERLARDGVGATP